ncbi:MAG: hypothetical protein V3R85_10290 [Alphaproteobacteria bacterium]
MLLVRSRLVVLLASLFVAGCTGIASEKSENILTEYGALLMQAAPDPDTKHVLARLLCDKQGLKDGTHAFSRCVMRLHGRDRTLSRARAAQGWMRAGQGQSLCMTLGDFTLTRCIDI